MLEKRFAKQMLTLFPAGSEPALALVACSGGVDSMALLDLLARYLARRRTKLAVCYVDHGQRPDTAEDVELISKAAVRFGLKYLVRTLALPKGASEDALRTARYQALSGALAEACTGEGLDPAGGVVFLAHHADDQLETFLFRLLRGAHPETIRGIPKRSRRGTLRLARPLLAFPKNELVNHARAAAIPWREDTTNTSSDYARNRIRNELLPLLEELRPGAARRLSRFFADLRAIQPAEAQASPKHIEQTALRLASADGIDIRGLSFHLLKCSMDQLLGEQSQRTSRSQWDGVKTQLIKRALTRTGGGPAKTIQFPGGHLLCFRGNRVFWLKTT